MALAIAFFGLFEGPGGFGKSEPYGGRTVLFLHPRYCLECFTQDYPVV